MVSKGYTKQTVERSPNYDLIDQFLELYGYHMTRTDLPSGKFKYDVYVTPLQPGQDSEMIPIRIGGLKASFNPNFITVIVRAYYYGEKFTFGCGNYSKRPRYSNTLTGRNYTTPCRHAELI